MKPKFILLLLGLILINLGCTSQADTAVKDESKGQAPPTEVDQSQVTIKGFRFEPETITISKGSMVLWTNQDQASHTVTSVEGSLLNSKRISLGGRYRKKFNEAGTFEYKCTIHPWMQKGTVIVE